MSKSAAANRKAAIIKKVQGFYAGIDGHGWDHVKRVYRTALWLTHQVGGSEEIVEAASLLHDIARSKEEKYDGPRNLDSVLSYTWEQKGGGPSGEFKEEAHAVI